MGTIPACEGLLIAALRIVSDQIKIRSISSRLRASWPVIALAKTIEENNIEDALETVRAALKTILESWAAFDGFIKEFKKQ